METAYWAQHYPEEVAAIIGLDMATPQAYDNYIINKAMLNLTSYAANIGLIRWIPGVSESDAMKFGTLSEEEKKLSKIVFYRRTATKTMLNEVAAIHNNAKTVEQRSIPDVPFLIFASNGEGTGWDRETWRALQHAFVNQTGDGKIIDLECPHYIHNYEYTRIAEEMNQFIGLLH